MTEKNIDILVTGAKGQLGSYLVTYFAKRSLLKDSRIGKVVGIDIEDLDIAYADDVSRFFGENLELPRYVVHCAAATDTTAIEKDPINFYAANCLGTKNIAEACAKNGIKLVLISTDYVLSELSPFHDGNLQEFPVNQYGLQKLIAELFAKDAFREKPQDLMVLRSSWMFGNSKHSFVEKFLKNAFNAYAKSGDKSKVQVQVVHDAYGRPTPVWFIASTIESLMLNGMHGTMDLQCPWPQISRYEWATMVWDAFTSCKESLSLEEQSLLDELKANVELVPVASSEIASSMHHPGLVPSIGEFIGDIKEYEVDTKAYVQMNIAEYAKMAMDIVKKGA